MNAPIGWVRGRYRLGGQSEFRPIETFDQQGSEWRASLATTDYTIRGLEYFLLYTSSDGQERAYGDSLNPLRLRIERSVGGPELAPLVWRMISAPVDVTQSANILAVMESQFGSQGPPNWRLGRWNPTTRVYDSVDAAQPAGFLPSMAYWLGSTRRQTNWALVGQTNLPVETVDQTAYFPVVLKWGWNMVGNPAAYRVSLAKSDLRIERAGSESTTYLQASQAALVGRDIQVWSPGSSIYVADRGWLDPWDGCFIRNVASNQGDLTLLIPAVEVTQPAAGPVNAEGSGLLWSLAVEAKTRGERGRVELALSASADPSEWDIDLPPPCPERRLEVGFREDPAETKEWSGELLSRDAQTTSATLADWSLSVSSPGEDVELSWSAAKAGLSTIAVPHAVLWMEDDALGQTWDMTRLESVALPAGEHTLRIWFARDVKEPPEPSSRFWIELHPNPSTSAGEIRYHLSSAGTVQVGIYDVTGVQVWGRPGVRATAGLHAVAWDGNDSKGERLRAGIYFLRVQQVSDHGAGAGDVQRASQKLTILR